MAFEPMLSGKLKEPHLQNITWPVLASPKLDGIRCVILNGVPLSRSLKKFPNKAVNDILKGLPSMDGELIVGSAVGEGVYNRTQSGIMSEEGVPEVTFWVFDVVLKAQLPFNQRFELANSWANASGNYVKAVPHVLIKSLDALLAYEVKTLAAGYEGVMLRSLDGPYKQGRSTVKEGYLTALKRWEDSEAEVLGTVEMMHNDNELTRDNLGRAKRSSAKAGKRPSGVMGALRVRDLHTKVEFELGIGFTDADRAEPWPVGTIVKYKFISYGVKEKPRQPKYIGLRTKEDM